MNRYFYTIIMIISFIILVFLMNIVLEGGNQAVRAIYRFSGDNSRVAEISKAYRDVQLGSEGEKKALDRKEVRDSRKEMGVLIETKNSLENLPRDPRIGNILDTTLANLQTANVSGNAVLSLLAKAVDMDEDKFTAMYQRIIDVPDITRLSPAEQESAMVVEVFARRDRIQTQIADYLSDY